MKIKASKIDPASRAGRDNCKVEDVNQLQTVAEITHLQLHKN